MAQRQLAPMRYWSRLLRVSHTCIEKWATLHNLPVHIKPSGRPLIRREDLLEWLYKTGRIKKSRK